MNNITQSFKDMIEELTNLKDFVKDTTKEIVDFFKNVNVRKYFQLNKYFPLEKNFRSKKNKSVKTKTIFHFKTNFRKKTNKSVTAQSKIIPKGLRFEMYEFAIDTTGTYEYLIVQKIIETQSAFRENLTNIDFFNNIDKTNESYDKFIKLIEELNKLITAIKKEIEKIEPLIPYFDEITTMPDSRLTTIINGTEKYIGIKKYVDEVKEVVDDFAKKINHEFRLSQSLAKMSANKLGQVLKEAPENIYQLSDENIDTFQAHYPFKENAEDEELGRRLEDGHIFNTLLLGNEERIRELKLSKKLDDKKVNRLLSNANVEIPEDSINTIKKYYPKAINNLLKKLLKTHTSQTLGGKRKNRNLTTRKNKN